MNKKIIVKQNGYKDCGPSCLLSIMRYYGLEASHEEISYIVKTDMNGTNAYNMINGCRLYGFDGYGMHYTYEEIINNNEPKIRIEKITLKRDLICENY